MDIQKSQIVDCAWKPNWEETKRHFIDWWNHEGLVIGTWGSPLVDHPRQDVPKPEPAASVLDSYINADWRARASRYNISQRSFAGDTLPTAFTDLGPGVLSTFLGSEPEFAPNTVWYAPVFQDVEEPEKLPPLRFDPENRWWKATENMLRKARELAGNDYLVGCPDLIENVDTLASLRDTQTLLMDFVERPDWVKQKVREINQVWFEAYNRIYDIIKLSDDSSVCWAFYIWGPGKTSKVQCDLGAMISPEMFGEFVVPSLTEQIEWLDHSMFHLDGTQCICHLDQLLAIEKLDAIEWTPQAGIEAGGSPRWYDLYRRILAAGKSLQVTDIYPEEVVPLLDAIGGKGVYIMAHFKNEREIEEMMGKVEQFR